MGYESEQIAKLYEEGRVRLGNGRVGYVKLVSEDVSLGYDLESFASTSAGGARFIEVKTFNQRGVYIFTSLEIEVLKTLCDRAFVYMVDVNERRLCRVIRDPFGTGGARIIRPHSFEITFPIEQKNERS